MTNDGKKSYLKSCEVLCVSIDVGLCRWYIHVYRLRDLCLHIVLPHIDAGLYARSESGESSKLRGDVCRDTVKAEKNMIYVDIRLTITKYIALYSVIVQYITSIIYNYMIIDTKTINACVRIIFCVIPYEYSY